MLGASVIQITSRRISAFSMLMITVMKLRLRSTFGFAKRWLLILPSTMAIFLMGIYQDNSWRSWTIGPNYARTLLHCTPEFVHVNARALLRAHPIMGRFVPDGDVEDHAPPPKAKAMGPPAKTSAKAEVQTSASTVRSKAKGTGKQESEVQTSDSAQTSTPRRPVVGGDAMANPNRLGNLAKEKVPTAKIKVKVSKDQRYKLLIQREPLFLVEVAEGRAVRRH